MKYKEYQINGTNYIEVKVPLEIRGEVMALLTSASVVKEGKNAVITGYWEDIYVNELFNITTHIDKNFVLSQIASLISQNEKLSKNSCKGVKCIERYSFLGNGILDCEIYSFLNADNFPAFIVNHYKKEVCACHGYAYSGKKEAKALGYTHREY